MHFLFHFSTASFQYFTKFLRYMVTLNDLKIVKGEAHYIVLEIKLMYLSVCQGECTKGDV